MLQLQSPIPQFTDLEGKPLNSGYVYIGTAGQNPETNPIQVYWDDAMTIPAVQPLRTLNGYVVRSGTPARVYVSADAYSITVKDRRSQFIMFLSDATSLGNLQTQLATSGGAGMIGWIQAGVGAVFRWVRDKLRERVSVDDFGADPTGATDSTAAIQAGIDYLASVGGGTLEFGRGTYSVTFITRKTNVRLNGAGCQATILRALPSASLGMVLINSGPVQHAGISNMALYGGNGVTVNAGQWAVYSESVASGVAPFDGGEWFSDWENVLVYYFDNGIWFKGGDAGFLLPHQFNTFRNVAVIRSGATLATGVSLKLTGQVGQFTDINGSYDGKTIGVSTNIFIGRNAGANAPYAINFIGTTSQTAERAIDTDVARNINVLGGHFENLWRAIRIGAASYGVNIRGNGFSNAGSDGAAGGYVLQVGAGADGKFCENYIDGAWDKVVSNGANTGFASFGNFVAAVNLPITATIGISKQINVTAGPPVSIDLSALNDIYVNTSASVITQINSLALPGERVTVKALGGPLYFAPGGNISLGSFQALTLQRNGAIVFQRADLVNTWELISVTDADHIGITTHGDANGILQCGGISKLTHIWNTPLTAARTAFLDVTNFAVDGSKFRIIRTAAATGAFNLVIGATGKNIAASATGDWVDVEYDGAAWNVTASGAL